MTAHCYSKVVCALTNRTPSWIFIYVLLMAIVTGIYHKVHDFNFEVINYPFPQSNIHSMLGLQHFIHNSLVSLDFVITSMISCFGQKLAIPN